MTNDMPVFEWLGSLVSLHPLSYGRSLSEVEIALFTGAWEDETYEQIAARSGYSLNYLQRDIGPKFWKLLSQTFERKLNKTNLRGVFSQLTPTEIVVTSPIVERECILSLLNSRN